jgi:hypothetical protein
LAIADSRAAPAGFSLSSALNSSWILAETAVITNGCCLQASETRTAIHRSSVVASFVFWGPEITRLCDAKRNSKIDKIDVCPATLALARNYFVGFDFARNAWRAAKTSAQYAHVHRLLGSGDFLGGNVAHAYFNTAW